MMGHESGAIYDGANPQGGLPPAYNPQTGSQEHIGSLPPILQFQFPR
jgi:hypothetical protein